MPLEALHLNAGEKAELYVKMHILAGQPVFTLDAQTSRPTERTLNFHSVYLKSTSSVSGGGFTEVLCGSEELPLVEGSIDPKDYLLREDLLQGLELLRGSIDGQDDLPLHFVQLLRRLGISGAGNQTNVDISGRLTGLDGDRKFGFSIKSFVGSQPTLLNASQENTNFRFKIDGDDDAKRCLTTAAIFPEISTTLNFLTNSNLRLVPLGAKSEGFKANLRFFGEGFDVFLGTLMLNSYSAPFKPRGIAENFEFGSGLWSETDKASRKYALQGFLRAAALGMTTKKPWNGRSETYGGYLILNEDYSVTSVGIQNDDDFRDYLFTQTYFESPSRNRHKYGFWYQEKDDWYLDLNLQVRFKKQ